MMRQIFQIIPGGTQFELQNAGFGSCAVSYQGAVVMIGGAFPAHGKVDGWEVNNNILFPISLSDTTLKATTSTLYPTFLRQDIRTPAPRSRLQVEKRFDSKICITRPKPAYGRQGLDWMVGPGYSFVVFSTNQTMETNQKP